ncbi:hypothetical protein A11S_2089 [Micavibrio aeruginosavorus EPB]|uniref:Uncharacterized protein n=1 Tax=Micavibrio aeruginosavorus EPB TaxID=349215 RepID=M4VI62_9BACT|nr:hypothetical protein A11S_2089 [Micavibrio aeruginosavorus EPB]
MKLEILKKLNWGHLTVVSLFFLFPIYGAAKGTMSHDSGYLLLLNFLAILFLVLLLIGIWSLPALILFGLYRLKGLTAEDIPDRFLYISCFIGFFLCLYAGVFFSDLYEAFQSAALEIIYEH